ncbi:MAG: hypothetical protein A2V90_07480 [Gammaproteobacteria bacterium RBG_16_57_12]|nr:MAG: hypothetical protein A2V90_07480 [Gammaproteobacteria bacterium RBG_16_57_12]
MQAWRDRLSAKEIEGLADYIQSDLMRIQLSRTVMQLPQRLKQGEKIYQQNCSVCHGDYGQTGVWTRSSMGKSAPRNFTADASKSKLDRSRMIDAVTHGKPGTAMMPYSSRLSPEQLGNVVDYIRVALMGFPLEQIEKEATQTPQAEIGSEQVAFRAKSLPDNLLGNPQEGRKLFVRNCVPCHGVKGDGDGPRAYFITPKPRNFVSEDTRRALNRPKIFNAVSNGLQGSVMPAWSKVLNNQEIANVSEYVFRAFIVGDYKGVSQQEPNEAIEKKN